MEGSAYVEPTSSLCTTCRLLPDGGGCWLVGWEPGKDGAEEPAACRSETERGGAASPQRRGSSDRGGGAWWGQRPTSSVAAGCPRQSDVFTRRSQGIRNAEETLRGLARSIDDIAARRRRYRGDKNRQLSIIAPSSGAHDCGGTPGAVQRNGPAAWWSGGGV